MLIGSLNTRGFNPARDFGPRVVAWIFGWGSAAFSDHTGGFFFVYILSPIIGGILAGLFFTQIIQKLMKQHLESCCCGKKESQKEIDKYLNNNCCCMKSKLNPEQKEKEQN